MKVTEKRNNKIQTNNSGTFSPQNHLDMCRGLSIGFPSNQ